MNLKVQFDFTYEFKRLYTKVFDIFRLLWVSYPRTEPTVQKKSVSFMEKIKGTFLTRDKNRYLVGCFYFNVCP